MAGKFKGTLNRHQGLLDEFQKMRDNLQEVIDNLVGILKSEMAGDKRQFEENLSKMFWFIYQMNHNQYGKKVEKILRELIAEKLKDGGYSVDKTAKNNLGDIIINKNGKMAVIEVKSYIDKTKSPQNIASLEQKRKKIGCGYFVFATGENFSKKYRLEFFRQEWTEKYPWIILQSYDRSEKNMNIWKHKSYKEYLPFHKLVGCIREALGG